MNMDMKVNVGNGLNNLMGKFFKEVSGVVYDLETGKVAIKRGDQNVVTLNEVKDGETSRFELTESPFNVSMSLPAFALRTELAKVVKGDLIVGNEGALGFVLEVDANLNACKMVKTDGSMSTSLVPTNKVLGKSSVMVVKSLNMFGDAAAGGMNPMLMMALMGNQNGGQMNPMLMMALMGGKDSKIDPMMLMLMAQGQNGGSGQMDPLMMMALMGGMGSGEGMNPMMMMALMGNQNGGTQTTTGGRPTANVWHT